MNHFESTTSKGFAASKWGRNAAKKRKTRLVEKTNIYNNNTKYSEKVL